MRLDYHQLQNGWGWIAGFLAYLWTRIKRDRLTVIAGYLSYVTSLSLVPLVAVIFGILSSFSVFNELKIELESLIYSNLVPTSGEVLRENINYFVAKAVDTTSIGIAALVVVALMLIHAIDTNLNYLWRSDNQRSVGQSLSVYWMVLTLGPLLMGVSLAATSYLLSLRIFSPEMLFGGMEWFLRIVPILFSIFTFWLIYAVVPRVRVLPQDAMVGAVIAALLFELAKRGFAFYVTMFPTYQTIYGALATIPITFVWIQISWLIILLGAEITATLGEYRLQNRDLDSSNESLA